MYAHVEVRSKLQQKLTTVLVPIQSRLSLRTGAIAASHVNAYIGTYYVCNRVQLREVINGPGSVHHLAFSKPVWYFLSRDAPCGSQ